MFLKRKYSSKFQTQATIPYYFNHIHWNESKAEYEYTREFLNKVWNPLMRKH